MGWIASFLVIIGMVTACLESPRPMYICSLDKIDYYSSCMKDAPRHWVVSDQICYPRTIYYTAECKPDVENSTLTPQRRIGHQRNVWINCMSHLTLPDHGVYQSVDHSSHVKQDVLCHSLPYIKPRKSYHIIM